MNAPSNNMILKISVTTCLEVFVSARISPVMLLCLSRTGCVVAGMLGSCWDGAATYRTNMSVLHSRPLSLALLLVLKELGRCLMQLKAREWTNIVFGLLVQIREGWIPTVHNLNVSSFAGTDFQFFSTLLTQNCCSCPSAHFNSKVRWLPGLW